MPWNDMLQVSDSTNGLRSLRGLWVFFSNRCVIGLRTFTIVWVLWYNNTGLLYCLTLKNVKCPRKLESPNLRCLTSKIAWNTANKGYLRSNFNKSDFRLLKISQLQTRKFWAWVPLAANDQTILLIISAVTKWTIFHGNGQHRLILRHCF